MMIMINKKEAARLGCAPRTRSAASSPSRSASTAGRRLRPVVVLSSLYSVSVCLLRFVFLVVCVCCYCYY